MFKFSRIAHMALASSLFLSMNLLPAQATLNEALAPYPDDTLAVASISLDLNNWGYLISKLTQGGKLKLTADKPEETSKPESKTDIEQGSETLPAEVENGVKDILKFMIEDLQFNPLTDGLLNLGSHLTVGYRPYPNSMGHAMFSLNLRSTDSVMRLLSNLEAKMKQEGNQTFVVKEKFGPTEIYHINLTDKAQPGKYQMHLDQEAAEAASENEDTEPSEEGSSELPFDFEQNQIHISAAGKNLLGSFGPNDDLLRRMLYNQEVLPQASRFKLTNNRVFVPVKDSLQNKAFWMYVDLKQTVALLESFDSKSAFAIDIKEQAAEETESEESTETEDQDDAADEQEMLNQLVSMYRGLGFGFDIHKDGVDFKSFVAPDWEDLSPRQIEYLEALNQLPQHDLKDLLERLPGDPAFFAAGQHLDAVIENPLPLDLEVPDLPFSEKDVREGLKKILNVDYKEEFLPLIDGRFGFGIFDAVKKDSVPQMVMFLGLKDNREADFDRLMQNKFRFDLSALESLSSGGDSEVELSAVQENMKNLQTMLGLYNIDHAGYPENIQTLLADAEAYDYSQSFKNPASGKTGADALKDYLEMGGEKPASDLVGTIFYQPRDPQKDEEGAAYFAGFAIYGYDLDGKLYRLNSSDEGAEFETVLDILPKVSPVEPKGSQPQLLETWQGTPIYSLGLEIPSEELELPPDLKPVFARKGNIWMLGFSLDALKAALGGGQPQNLRHKIQHSQSQDASSLFYLDPQKAAKLFKGFAPAELSDSKEVNEFIEAIKPWRSLFGSSFQRAKGTEGLLNVDVDMDKVDLSKLSTLAQESPIDEPEISVKAEESPEASLKANMHSLQVMIETYGVDWGGVYPDNLAQLYAETHQPDKDEMYNYWKDLHNPYAGGSSFNDVMADFINFKPGPEMKGKLLYAPERVPGQPTVNYSIYAADEAGELLQQKGQTFYLSNS